MTDRLLVAVFVSPVSEVLLRWGAELGFRTVLVEPSRVVDSAADVTVRGFDELDAELAGGDADVVVTDHHREELGELLRDAGWDGAGRPRGGLAILPGRTHYDVVEAPELAGVVATFLDATDRS